VAIIKRSDSEPESVTPAHDPIAVQEPPAEPAAAAPPPQSEAAGLRSMTEALPSALEPELRRIIDTAVARVAAIELEAIREARELTQRSEQEARDALRFALDRAFNLINTLELLAATVSGMAEALKIELDDAIDALRNVPEPESALAKEMAQAAAPTPAPAAEPEPQPEPQPQTEPEPEAQAAIEAPPTPEPAPEPPPAPEPAPEPQREAVAEAPPAPEPEPQKAPPVAATPVAEAPREEGAAEQDTQGPETGTGNGYAPAQRQAESLAAVTTRDNDDAEPQPTEVPATTDEDGAPAVPARRRGLMRRLFSK
jgi:outer membrane biosynthesis protein TonB